MIDVLISDKMIKLVFCFILKHFCQKLRGRNVSVEFFALVLDGRALVFEYHGTTSLAIFQLNIVASQCFTVN